MHLSPFTPYAVSFSAPARALVDNLGTMQRIKQAEAAIHFSHKPTESREANAIDIIASKKFGAALTDMETPAVTAVGRLFDKFINFLFGKQDSIASTSHTNEIDLKPRLSKREFIDDEYIYIDECNERFCVTKFIQSNYHDLGWGTFIFQHMPVKLTPATQRAECIYAHHTFETIFDKFFVWSLFLEDSCQLYWQQRHCIERHLGAYFSSNSESLDPWEIFSSSPLNSTAQKLLSRPSEIHDATWKIKISAKDRNGTRVDISKAFLNALEERLVDMTQCELHATKVQIPLFLTGMTFLGLAGVSILVYRRCFSDRYNQKKTPFLSNDYGTFKEIP